MVNKRLDGAAPEAREPNFKSRVGKVLNVITKKC